jgi:hypothetical protein
VPFRNELVFDQLPSSLQPNERAPDVLPAKPETFRKSTLDAFQLVSRLLESHDATVQITHSCSVVAYRTMGQRLSHVCHLLL